MTTDEALNYDLYSKNTLEVIKDEVYNTTYVKLCYNCGSKFESSRKHALTCSDVCRQSIHKLRKKGIVPTLPVGTILTKSSREVRALKMQLSKLSDTVKELKLRIEKESA